jgi:antitoxin FitA
MTVITIRDVSEDDNQRLKEQAELKGQSLQRFLRDELHAIAQRTPLEQALAAALEGLEPSGISTDMIVAAIRQSRDEDAT